MAMTDTTGHVFLMPCLQLPSCSLVALSVFFPPSLSVVSQEKSVDPSSSRRRSSVTAGSVHTTLMEYFNTGMLVCLKLYLVAVTDIATQSYQNTHTRFGREREKKKSLCVSLIFKQLHRVPATLELISSVFRA